jgi:hypothetical protein
MHDGSNDTIGGRVRPQWRERLLSSHEGILILEQTYDVTTVYLPAVLLTLVNSLLPLLLTLAIKLFPFVFDTGQK